MRAPTTNKRKINQHWWDLLTTSYLILTMILGLSNFFRLGQPTPMMVLIFEIVYLTVSLIFTMVVLVNLQLFLIKIKRTNFKLPPLKIQLHAFNLLAVGLWGSLVLIYGFQSAVTLFGKEPKLIPSFLNHSSFNYLITTQFSLTIYLLISMAIIFIYALILHQRENIKIKIVPNNFLAFETAQFKSFTSFPTEWFPSVFIFWQDIKFCFYQFWVQIVVLSLRLKHLKTLALRQFKKETTPPSSLLFIN